MSTKCTKEFTLKVNPATVTPIDAYWTLDAQEPITQNLLDSVTLLALEPTGPVDVVEPALISNGLHFSGLFGGQGYTTTPTVILGHLATDSFSLWGWYRINSTGDGDATGGPSISYQTGAKAININVGSGLDPNPVHIHTASDQVYLAATLGDWHFFHLCWNATTQLFGYSVDNAAITYFPTAIAVPADTNGIVQIEQHFVSNNGDILFDEMGLTLEAMLTPAQQAYLYNSGAGRTWPITLP